MVLQSELDSGQSPCNLARNECLAALWRFMVKKNAAANKHSVGFAVIHALKMRRSLRHAVGAPGMKRRVLFLWRLRGTKHLGVTGVIEAGRGVSLRVDAQCVGHSHRYHSHSVSR